MTKEVEAVYENGVLRPLESLPLAEHQHVRLVVAEISEDPFSSLIDQDFLDQARTEVAGAGAIPTLEEVQQMTAGD